MFRKTVSRFLSLTFVFLLVITSTSISSIQSNAAKKAKSAKKVNVTKVMITKPTSSNLVIKKGKTYSLKTSIKVKPNTKANRKLVFKSSKPKVISVTKTGKLKAKKAKGNAVITVASAVKSKKKAKLNVTIGIPATDVSTSRKTAEIAIDASINLSTSITLNPADATIKTLAWTSSNPNVATVNNNGVVIGKSEGTANITASTTDGSNKKTDIIVTVKSSKWRTATKLKDLYKFDLGVAIPVNRLASGSEETLLALHHFNSITSENDNKPESLLDWPGSEANIAAGIDKPAVKLSNLDKGLTFAKENNLKVRFHTLVWYAQTPKWFFCEQYDTDKNYVSKEVMLKRLESYINQIVDYVETKYPGVVYAYDVVNEAIEDGPTGHKDHFNIRINNNQWDKTIGWEFVKYSFQYAKAATTRNNSSAKLFYNDYNTYDRTTNITNMINDVNADGKLCDGVGMQAHLNLGLSMNKLWNAIQTFKNAGFEIHITELDITLSEGSAPTKDQLDKQASMYKTCFDMFKNTPEITSVTIWGVDDITSWRSSRHPLLFFGDLTPKPAFFGVLQDPSIPLLNYR